MIDEFKVGDKVRYTGDYYIDQIRRHGINMEVIEDKLDSAGFVRARFPDGYTNTYPPKDLELIKGKGVKKVKEEKRHYIIVDSDCDNIEQDRLLTKSEITEGRGYSVNEYIIDINTGKRFTVVTTNRLVPIKPESKKSKRKKKTKGVRNG